MRLRRVVGLPFISAARWSGANYTNHGNLSSCRQPRAKKDPDFNFAPFPRHPSLARITVTLTLDGNHNGPCCRINFVAVPHDVGPGERTDCHGHLRVRGSIVQVHLRGPGCEHRRRLQVTWPALLQITRMTQDPTRPQARRVWWEYAP